MRNKILIQALIVVGFMTLPLLFMAGDWASKGEFVLYNPYDLYSVFVYVGLLAAFFINYYILIPTYYSQKKYITYVMSIIGLVLILISVQYIFKIRPHERHLKGHSMFHDKLKPHTPGGFSHEPHHEAGHRRPRKPPPFFQLSQYLFLLLIGLLTGLYIRVRNNLAELTNESNKAAIASLKSQINPHFLFNTLNSIYAISVKENAPQTSNGMLKLSGMMRYVLTDSAGDFVLLERELSYISSYVDLQKLRLDKGIDFQYSIEGDPGQLKIAPLILIPFIENCFKHGVNPDEHSVIRIHVKIAGNQLTLNCQNNIVFHGHQMEEKLGLGIKNTAERLNLIYPGRHQLVIEEKESNFQVDLTIILA